MEILGCGMVHPNVLRICRHRPDRIPGLRLRHGDRAHRDAEIRHPRPAHRSTTADLRWLQPLRLRAAGCQPTMRRRALSQMKFTLVLAEGPSGHRRLARGDRREADHARPRGRGGRGPRRGASRRSASRMWSRRRAAPERRPSAGLHGRCRRRRSVQVVCGAPNARTGMKGVFAAAGQPMCRAST
ncbi:MAG: hypothetical protein ACMVO3_05270 [Thalassobaculum sp.]